MAGLIHGLDPTRIASNLERVKEEIGTEVEILAATKYVPVEEMGALAEVGAFIARCPVMVAGLMTMPPFSQDPEASRPHFARLARLADEHGLERLSMGTSQDYRVAVEEGATIVRLGVVLYA